MSGSQIHEKKDYANWMRVECGFCFTQYTPEMIDGVVVITCPIQKCGQNERQTILQTWKD